MDWVKDTKKQNGLPGDRASTFIGGRADIGQPFHNIVINFDVLVTVAFSNRSQAVWIGEKVNLPAVPDMEDWLLNMHRPPHYWLNVHGLNPKILEIVVTTFLLILTPYIVWDTTGAATLARMAIPFKLSARQASKYLTVSPKGRPSAMRMPNVFLLLNLLAMCYLIRWGFAGIEQLKYCHSATGGLLDFEGQLGGGPPAISV